MKNLSNYLALKVILHKTNLVLLTKSLLFIAICYFIINGLTEIAVISLIDFLLPIFFILLIGSIVYFSLTPNKDDRDLLLKIWKTYLSIITLMLILLFSTEDTANKMKIDFQKNKLEYELKTDSENVDFTFSKYESLVIKYLKNYENKEIKKTKEQTKEIEEDDYYTNDYANFSFTVMIITSLFICIWGLSELSIFQEVKRREINRSIKIYK